MQNKPKKPMPDTGNQACKNLLGSNRADLGVPTALRIVMTEGM